MKICFFDPYFTAYTPSTPRHRALSGTQSAVCHLSRELAAQGHEVVILNCTETPIEDEGVRVEDIRRAGRVIHDTPFDAVVAVNSTYWSRRLRATARPSTRLVLWAHVTPAQYNAGDQLKTQLAAFDRAAFVSDWQRRQFLDAGLLAPERAGLVRNALPPDFEALFAPGEAILAAKDPHRIAYTSNPLRGLDRLPAFLPILRAGDPAARLDIFSDLARYDRATPPAVARAFAALAAEPGVTVRGSLPQPTLARELRRTALWFYPNTRDETFCITALEALAAGCLVVAPEKGALAETLAGFGETAPLVTADGWRFGALCDALSRALDLIATGGDALERRLRAQVDHIAARHRWRARVDEVAALLAET
jgi:glycosyltransferase involved in cell wall biosynthesis